MPPMGAKPVGGLLVDIAGPVVAEAEAFMMEVTREQVEEMNTRHGG